VNGYAHVVRAARSTGLTSPAPSVPAKRGGFAMIHNDISGARRSPTPLGSHEDAAPTAGQMSRNSLYNRGSISEREREHMRQTYAHYRAAQTNYRHELEALRVFVERLRKEAEKRKQAAGPGAAKSGPRRPVGPPPRGAASAPAAAQPGKQEAGGPAEGTYSPEARIVGEFSRRLVENWTKAVIHESGVPIRRHSDRIWISAQKRRIAEAKRKYDAWKWNYLQAHRGGTGKAIKQEGQHGSRLQMLGGDEDGSKTLEEMGKLARAHAAEVTKVIRDNPGKEGIGDMYQVVGAAEVLDIVGEEGSPEGEELRERMNHYLNTGGLTLREKDAKEKRRDTVYVVQTPPDKPPAGCRPDPHVVARGDWLSKIAASYYGDAHMLDGAQAIYRVNQGTIGDDWNKIEIGMKLWIPVEPR
jgi:hypothetical protein